MGGTARKDLGSGATQRIQQQIASIGSNVVIILPGSITASGVRLGTGIAVTLSEADAHELSAQCPDISAASPVLRGGTQVVYGNSNWATVTMGVTPPFLLIRDLTVAAADIFTPQDAVSSNKVALLGKTVVDNLFGSADPDRPDNSDQECPLHHHGRSRAQGPISYGAGPG